MSCTSDSGISSFEDQYERKYSFDSSIDSMDLHAFAPLW